MPIVSIPFLDVDQTITRPSILDVIRQVKDITGIPQDVPVVYLGQGESRVQSGSAVGSQSDTVQMASQRMVTIEVDERFEEGFFATNAGHRPEQRPDFIDPALGVIVKPIYSVSEFDVNFIYRTPSRTEAMRWRADAQFRASQMRDVNMHALTYYYMIPTQCISLLKHIHELREKQAPYGDTFEEYINERATTRATDLSNIVGEKIRLGIRETQMRVQGVFDFQAQPERQEKNSDAGAWEVRFVYKFSFSKPIAASVQYPIIVHNQLIDEKFIPQIPVDHEAMQARAALSTSALHYFEAQRMQALVAGEKTLRFHPAADEWQPRVVPPDTRAYLSLLLSIDPADSTALVNLSDLGDFVIDPEILQFIAAGEHFYLNKLHSSLMQISLYRNEQMVRHDRFTIDANLNVKLLEPSDLRCTYRLMISFCSDITKVDYRAVRRALPYPNVLQKLVRITRANRGQIRRLLPYLDIEHLFMDLPNTGYSRQQIIDSIVSMKTVMNSYVEASRIDAGTTYVSARFQEPKLGAPQIVQP